MDATDDSLRCAGRPATERTALVALVAGMPALGITAIAAASANALAIWADLALTLIDLAALAAVWWTVRRGGAGDAEGRALLAVGLCMALSLLAVTALAAERILAGGVALGGPGVGLALAQNAGYALVNGWLLWRWRLRMRAGPSAFVRSQLRLFSDKLCCNLVLCASLAATLAIADVALAAAIDAATSVLLAAMSAWWFAPVLATAWRQLARA